MRQHASKKDSQKVLENSRVLTRVLRTYLAVGSEGNKGSHLEVGFQKVLRMQKHAPHRREPNQGRTKLFIHNAILQLWPGHPKNIRRCVLLPSRLLFFKNLAGRFPCGCCPPHSR